MDRKNINRGFKKLRFSIQYIGRYTKTAVMAEYRIVYYDGKIIRFSYK